MSLGMIILLVVSILIFLGFAQRVLDRMHLSDRAALLFIGAMFLGGLIPDIRLADNLRINVGGGIIPIILVGYLFYKANTPWEKQRSVVAIIATAIIVYATLKLIPLEPTYTLILDPLYVVGLISGIVGYLTGRSRRAAFMGGVSAIILTDVFSRIENFFTGGRGTTVIGGAGMFDATIIAGLIAVGLAELVGETRERLQGGPENERRHHWESIVKEFGETSGKNQSSRENQDSHNRDNGE